MGGVRRSGVRFERNFKLVTPGGFEKSSSPVTPVLRGVLENLYVMGRKDVNQGAQGV